MSIPTTIAIREFNTKLTLLETCAEMAPEGIYEHTKTVVEALHTCSNTIMDEFRGAGLKVDNCDALRVLEAAIYRYVLECNPEPGELDAAEGFGLALSGPARDRVIAQSIRDRDFLASRAEA